MDNLWTCPKCKRVFVNKNQVHSCRFYPVEKHLEGKNDLAKSLYEILLKKMEKEIGPFRIESLPCCIHFVKDPAFAFAGVYILKDKIRIHFALKNKIESSRIDKVFQMSSTNYRYSLDIEREKKIDNELLNWLKKVYELK